MAPEETGVNAAAKDPNRRPTALVTGASYGIGAAIALALAREHYDLAITDLSTDMLERTVSELEAAGARVLAVPLELRSPDSIKLAFAEAIRALGQLDVLINNAGIPLMKAALDIAPHEWEDIIKVNLTGTFLASREMGRHLIDTARPGCIISIASAHGVLGAANQAGYGTSKAGIIQMTRSLAIEWVEHGVRVNAIAPGKIDTPSPLRLAAMANPVLRERSMSRIPMRRFGESEEVAAMACYLAGPGAAYVTGQTFLLDGGLAAA
jgi:NAD(P)-dependent dehydrogenase (short-subunit alcohol dehydrogenase family)